MLSRPLAPHGFSVPLAPLGVSKPLASLDFSESRLLSAQSPVQLSASGVAARQYESWDLGVVTTSDYGEASVLDESWPKIHEAVGAIPSGTVAVITGFIGKDVTGRVTTLGRGGSDLTASLLGAASGFDEVLPFTKAPRRLALL